MGRKTQPTRTIRPADVAPQPSRADQNSTSFEVIAVDGDGPPSRVRHAPSSLDRSPQVTGRNAASEAYRWTMLERIGEDDPNDGTGERVGEPNVRSDVVVVPLELG
jgi:hypothetical protein